MASRIKLKVDKKEINTRFDLNGWWRQVPILNDVIYSFIDDPRTVSALALEEQERKNGWLRLSEGEMRMNQISNLLEKSQQRQNWNFFVGDQRLRTNFFLQFLNPTTERMYEIQLISGSLYSIRIFLVLQFTLLSGIGIAPFSTTSQATPSKTTSPELEQQPVEAEAMNEQILTLIYLGAFMIGFIATLKRSWKSQTRQLCLNLTTFLVQNHLLLTFFKKPQNKSLPPNEVFLLFLPALITNLLCVGSWITFLCLMWVQLGLGCLFYFPTNKFKSHEQVKNTFYLMALVIPCAFVFALFEKVNKERFVINQSNQLTRKLFGELINASSATVTVSTDGKISFFNEPFRQLLIDRLQFENLPFNIFSIFDPDDFVSIEKLQEMLLNTYQFDKGKNRAENCAVIEVRIPLMKQPQANRLNFPQEEQKDQIIEENKEKSQSQSQNPFQFSLSAAQNCMKIFEMVRISCKVSEYSANKCLILKLERVTDYQGHAQLVINQSQLLQSFLTRFQGMVVKKMLQERQNSKKPNAPLEVFSEQIELLQESLQNPQYILYCLSQIQFQVKLMSIMSVAQTLGEVNRVQKDFLFGQSVIQTIQECSNLIEGHPEIAFNHDDRLPDVLNGDPDMLKLAIQTLTEFSLKYGRQESQVNMSSVFDQRMADEQTYLVSFKIIIPVNNKYDPSIITTLLQANNFFEENQVPEINKFIMERSIVFSDYISEFGIGLLLLPVLIQMLDAKITTKYEKEKRQKTRSITGSVSGRSGLANNEINENGVASLNLVINLQLPLNQPEKSNVEEHKQIVIVPIEFSNRRVDGSVTSWKSSTSIRMGALQKNTKNDLAQMKVKQDSDLIQCPTRPNEFKTIQISTRVIDRELINNQYLKQQSGVLTENGSQCDLSDDLGAQIDIVNQVQMMGEFNNSRSSNKTSRSQMQAIQETNKFISNDKEFLTNAKRQDNEGLNDQVSSIQISAKKSRKVQKRSYDQKEKIEVSMSDVPMHLHISKVSSGLQKNMAISMDDLPPLAKIGLRNLFNSSLKQNSSEVSNRTPNNILPCENIFNAQAESSSSKSHDSSSFSGGSIENQRPIPAEAQNQIREAAIVVEPQGNSLRAQEMQSSDHERPSMIIQPQIIDVSAVGGLSQHLTPQQAPDFRIIQSITNPAIQELIRPQVQAEPIPEQNMLIERQQNQIEDLNEGPVLLEEHKWPPIDQLEENYKRSLDQKFSENLQSILLDERLAGVKDAQIFANDPEIDGFQPDDVRHDNSFHSDSEDDKEVILTEQEQQDLKARKKRIYEAYLLKLQRERDQERARYQDILRQKDLEQKKSQCYEDGEDSSLPLIQMRHDDLLGKSQHIKFDVNGASGAIKFKRESPGNKQVLQVPIRSTKMATKLDMDKFSIDEKVRDVHRRILQQNALIQSNKERHQTFVPHLTDIQEIEEERKDIVEEIKEEKKEERSNYLIEEEKQGSNGPMMIFEESSKQQYISNSQNFQIDQKRPQSKPQEECKQSEISLKLGNLEDQDFSLIDEESVSQTQSQFSPQEEARQSQKAQTESEKEMNLKRLLKDIDKIDLVGLCIPEHLKISLSNVKDQIQKLNQNRYHSSIAINNSYSKFSGLENRQVSGLSDDNIRKKNSKRPKQLDGQSSDQLFNFEQEGEIHDKQASESNSLKSSLIEAKTPPQGSINSAEQDKSDQICRPFKSLQEEKLPKLSAEEINRNKFLQEKQRYYLESMRSEGLVPAMIIEEASSIQSNQNSHLAQSQESCFNDLSAIKSSQSLILVQSDQNAGKIKIRRQPKPSKSDKAVKFFVKDFENTLKIPNKNNSQVIPNVQIDELKEVHQQKNGVGVSNANVDESAAIWRAKQVSALKSPLKEGLYEKRRAAFRITNLPRRQFANLGMLRDHCQKTIGPDSYFIMTQLAEKDVQIQNQGGLTWDKTMIKGKHRRRKNNWEEDQDYTSRSSIKSVEATQEVKKDGQNVEGGQNSAEEVKAAEIKAKA